MHLLEVDFEAVHPYLNMNYNHALTCRFPFPIICIGQMRFAPSLSLVIACS